VGEQPQPEHKIELCTLNIVDLPIINFQDAGRAFKIKVSTIRMKITIALERFNEYIRAEFLEWHIGLLKRRMEKMGIEREAQYLKATKERSTCEECEEYGHVQGKPRFNASSPSKIWFLFVHNARTSRTSKLRLTRTPLLRSRLWRKYWRI
jgi:hypothetical protein